MVTVICSYFNRFRSERRERAYVRFRTELERAGISVVCVEQVFPGISRVSGSADLAIDGGDVLWQKECLLQLGINNVLASGETKLVVADADIVFETPDAWERINRSFESLDWFQPFESVSLDYSDGVLVKESALSFQDPIRYGFGHPGSCWAGTASFFRAVSLYPYALLGGGDVIMTHLLASSWKHGARSQRFQDLATYISREVLYPGLLPSILEWAAEAGQVRFRRGCTSGVHLRALDHGSHAGRRYHNRYRTWSSELLSPLPGKDFCIGANGLLKWVQHPNKWEPVATRYFESRERDSLNDATTDGI